MKAILLFAMTVAAMKGDKRQAAEARCFYLE
jgi:hypothetical protein